MSESLEAGRSRSSRRAFLRTSGGAAGALALAGPLGGLACAPAPGTAPGVGYGPLQPVADRTTGLPLLRLPEGFTYESFGWSGDPMDDGTPTPDRHDGMAVVASRGRGRHEQVTLVRNHERGPTLSGGAVPVIGAGAAPVYDAFAQEGLFDGLGGGTTALTHGPAGFTGSRATLGGTLVNCAGGPTPWGSWLTCEEIVLRGTALGARDHGYVFEVPGAGEASAVPIVGMGLMKHEAAAVDPASGHVYLTEDNGPASGFYRFTPASAVSAPGGLEAAGGTLAMLAVVGAPNADLRGVAQGEAFDVEWVPVAEPDADPEAFVSPGFGLPPIVGAGRSGPFLQGEAAGGATFARGEGCWHHDGVVYMVDTGGGPAGKGTVWALRPGRRSGAPATLTALFVSPGEETADNIDNITVSPRGGLVTCEDGGGLVVDGARRFGTRLVGIDRRARPFVLAENTIVIDAPPPGRPSVAVGDHRGSEFCGATFSPSGRHLFVNIQAPGVTFAITGPWHRGPL